MSVVLLQDLVFTACHDARMFCKKKTRDSVYVAAREKCQRCYNAIDTAATNVQRLDGN